MLALLATGLLACSTEAHEEFCNADKPCPGDQVCESNLCVDALVTEPDAAVDVPDAQPTCPQTHECLAGAPAGWMGPAIRSELGADQSPKACPEAFGVSPGPLYSEISASGSCGCECGTPQSLSCTAATIQGRDGGTTPFQCFGPAPVAGYPSTVLNPVSLPVGSNSCTDVSDITAYKTLKVSPGLVGTATCGAGTPVDNLETPSFAQQTSLCAVQPELLTDGCELGDVCAPKLETQEATCIYKEGEHECPADSPYSVAQIVYEDINDKRSCGDSCECELPAGAPCGRVSISAGSCQTIAGFAGGCHAMPFRNQSTSAHFYADPADHNCSAAGEGDIEGEAVGTDDITICCMP